MNKNIAENLQYFERSISMLNDESDKAIRRYNTIMKNYYNNEGIIGGLEAAGGNFLLNGSKALAIGSTATGTALATTTTATGLTAGSTTLALPGAVAGAGTAAGAAAPPVIPIALAFIGGLKFGEGIGKVGVALWDRFVVGKEKLNELDSDVKELKGYCSKMYDVLYSAYNDLVKAKEKILTSLDKIKDQEYKTKKSNVKRIKYRANEIDAILVDIKTFMDVINVTNKNLSKLS